MASEAVKREAERGKRLLEEWSQQLFQQQVSWRDWQKGKALSGISPSTQGGGRGATSPLPEGRALIGWSGKEKRDGDLQADVIHRRQHRQRHCADRGADPTDTGPGAQLPAGSSQWLL